MRDFQQMVISTWYFYHACVNRFLRKISQWIVKSQTVPREKVLMHYMFLIHQWSQTWKFHLFFSNFLGNWIKEINNTASGIFHNCKYHDKGTNLKTTEIKLWKCTPKTVLKGLNKWIIHIFAIFHDEDNGRVF